MKSYKRKILVFLIVSLLIVVGSFTILFLNFRKQLSLQDRILVIQANLTHTDSIITNLLQVESDKRAFQITSDISYLKNFYAIRTGCNGSIDRLKSNVSDKATISIISEVDRLMELRLANMDSGLAVFRKNGAEAAIIFMQDPNKRSIRERLALQLHSLKSSFQEALQSTTAGINKKSEQNIIGLLVLVLVFISLMFIAARTFRRAQHRVIMNHLKFKEAQRIAKIGSWEWNFKTNRLKWSQEQFRIFGETRGEFELTYKGYLTHFPIQEQQKIMDLMHNAIDAKTEFIIEHDIRRRDGTSLTVMERGNLILDKDNNPVGMFGTTQDISERKDYEKQLLQAELKYRSIIDNSADGIYQSTPDGKFVMVNPSMAGIFGYASPAEMIYQVQNIGIQIYADPADRQNMSEMITRQGHIENYEMQVLKKDGSRIWVSANIRILRNDDGTVQFYEGILEDISERKRAEEEILQLNKSLEQFANITAHDLQEPIRMVSGFLGLLEKKYAAALDEQGKGYIFRAKDGADRMSILIRDLLEFSRSGNKAAKKEPVNLESVIDLVQKDMSIVMQDTSAGLYVPEKMPVVEGTHSALYRLFLNLVSNGIKFRKKDTSPQVSILLNEQTDCWEFTVQDNGIGVPEKDQPKLFQAFQRLHRKEDYPGTGLGLVTCKKIVETHGGKIWMTSEFGKGTAFHFTLPKMRA